MKKALALGALLTGTGLGCGGPEVPMEMGLVMDGYTIPCEEIEGGHTPLSEQEYCSEGQDEARIPSSHYAAHKGEFRNALNCAYQGLITFDDESGIHEAPEVSTLFVGGKAAGTVGGKTVGDYGGGESFTYVIDTLSWGLPLETCYVLNVGLHEVGHMLFNIAKYQSGRVDFTTYGLDQNDHDPRGTDAVMTPDGICAQTPNFSDASARALAENLDLDDTGQTPAQIQELLMTIRDRCDAEIQAVLEISGDLK